MNQILVKGIIPAERELSTFVDLYKRKRDALERGNYRVLKTADQILAIPERFIEKFIRQQVRVVSHLGGLNSRNFPRVFQEILLVFSWRSKHRLQNVYIIIVWLNEVLFKSYTKGQIIKEFLFLAIHFSASQL